MRHKYTLLTLSVVGITAAFAISTISGKDLIRTDAYSIPSKLETTIDLNDTSEANVRAYYSALSSQSESERSGTNLLKNLKPILKNNQVYYGYDGSQGKKVWQMYEIIDRDWDLSPASDIAGYNPTTNTITGYKYEETNPYLHALYVDRSMENHMHAWKTENGKSSHGGNGEWCIDREHIWPKAEGFEDEGAGGARGDPMHLWSGDSGVNSALHSNYYYGYVADKGATIGYDWEYTHHNKMGTSKTLGGTIKVFEPQNSDKGDIARAVFYMVARYNFLSGSDSDGLSSDNPNLALTNSLSDWADKGYMCTLSAPGKMGILEDLLEWNRLDPPDEWEIHRNNLLYNNYTKNRNPFIDFPSWADYVWGKESKAADPQNDVLNSFEEDTTPRVTSVKLDKTELTLDLKKNTSSTLVATVDAKYGADASVTWSSSDTSIATVDANGKVTAVKEGEVTITCTSNFDNTKKATCKVTVSKGTNMLLYIAIGAGVIVVVLILLFCSKSFRKGAKKAAKKQVKKSVKSYSKGKTSNSKKR